MLKTIRRKKSFPAKDAQGQTHILDVFVDIVDIGTFDDPNAKTEYGLGGFRTRSRHRKYLGAMRAGISCALANRQILTHLARRSFAQILPKAKLEILYDRVS